MAFPLTAKRCSALSLGLILPLGIGAVSGFAPSESCIWGSTRELSVSRVVNSASGMLLVIVDVADESQRLRTSIQNVSARCQQQSASFIARV